MIEIRDIDGRNCPVIICDRCNEQIANGRGNVEWKDYGGPGADYRIVHKLRDCRKAVDDEEDWPLWQELEDFSEYLRLNTGLALGYGNRECFECGETAENQHHVVPRSLGGVKTLPLCTECHHAVHSPGQALSIGTLAKIAARQRKGDA
jgi:5-methylcytosine-specific restriction endonuclease McrA